MSSFGQCELTSELQAAQNAKVLRQGRICQELHYTACNTVDGEDGTDIAWVKPEPTREVEWQLGILRRVLLDRIAEEHGDVLVVRNGVESQECVSGKIDHSLVSEDVAVAVCLLRVAGVGVSADRLAGEKGCGCFAVNEGGAARRVLRTAFEGTG